MKNILLITLVVWLVSFASEKNNDPATVETKKIYRWDEFNMGVDLSYVNQVEDYGGVYRDSNQIRDCLKILKDHGANTVRIRLWHTPTWVGKLNNGKMY
jgi:arabinogalactan endo-1,4-beta-galactosidase